jgi:hypothetical protein
VLIQVRPGREILRRASSQPRARHHGTGVIRADGVGGCAHLGIIPVLIARWVRDGFLTWRRGDAREPRPTGVLCGAPPSEVSVAPLGDRERFTDVVTRALEDELRVMEKAQHQRKCKREEPSDYPRYRESPAGAAQTPRAKYPDDTRAATTVGATCRTYEPHRSPQRRVALPTRRTSSIVIRPLESRRVRSASAVGWCPYSPVPTSRSV